MRRAFNMYLRMESQPKLQRKKQEKNYHAGKVQSFDNKAEIAEEVLKIITQNDVVLLKGSRGMALEEIVQKWI